MNNGIFDKNQAEYEKRELPVELTLAFARDADAFVRFTQLSLADQDELVAKVGRVRTKRELERLIDTIELPSDTEL